MVRNALTFNAANSKYWKEAVRFYKAGTVKLEAATNKTRL